VVAALAAVLVVAGVPAARAQEPAPKRSDDPAAVEARRHYEEGTKAFNLGEFPRAIAEFKAAYNAKDDPSLLYNIAQSFRLEGDAAQAVFFYRSFLRNMPTAPNRREVEGRIHTLEKQLEDQKKEEQKKEAAAPVAPVPDPAPVPPVVAPAPVAPPAPEPPPATATIPAAPPAPEPVPVEKPLPTAPPPVEAAPAAADLTRAPAEPSSAASKPFYKKWWFWTAVGVVAVVGLGAGIAAARDKPPSTSLGLYDPIWVKP